MKLLKVLGITTLISGVAVIPTWIYNEIRWENYQKLWWSENMVRHYSSEKYNELKNAGIEDLKVWQEAEYALRDSVEQARKNECEAQKAYFEGGNAIKKTP